MAGKDKNDEPFDQKIKMETLNKIMQSESSIVCGRDIMAICEQYHESLENLTEICHIDPHFSHVVSGSGFVNIPLLLYLRETEVSPDILYLAQAQPVQKVLYVHRHSVVLKDPLTHWQKDCPLLLYVSDLPCRSPDNVKIFISSKTHSHMLRGTFGINFTERSTVVLEDLHKTVKFFLSSKSFLKTFSEQMSNFLSCYKPTLAVVDRKNMRSVSVQEENILIEHYDGKSRLELYAIKTIPALYLPDWPEKAFSWQTRRKPSGWPAKDLIMEIISKGCHVIPASQLNNGSSEKIPEDTDWTLCFELSEKRLFSSLCELDKQACFIFRSLICDRQSIHRGKITIDHIKAVLLWTFEECPVDKEEGGTLLSRFMQIASKFMDFLSSGRCRHYFIPERNLFEMIPMEELENIRDMVDELLQQPWIFILHCHLLPYAFYNKRDQVETLFFSPNQNDDRRTDIINDFTAWCESMRKLIFPQVNNSFIESFNDTVRLYVLTSCARANSLTLNESIIHHRDTLRMAQDQFLESPYIGPFADILCSNLACMYHVKGLTSLGKREKEYYLIKAEGLLKETKTMDMSLGRTRLANLYFSVERFSEAVSVLEELLDLLDEVEIRRGNSSPDDVRKLEEDHSVASSTTFREKFRDMLWEKWLQKDFTYDVIYNHASRHLCPPVMKQSFSLTMCTTLGAQRNSAAVFSPVFHGRFLLALCEAKLFHTDKALDILLGLDAVLSHPQMIKALESSSYSDVNEKRIAGYYIVLGNCYIAIGENEKAKTAFKKALKVFPTPRNPANLLYMSVRYEDTVNGIKQGAKALILASALSFTYSYMTSQLQ